MVEEIGLFEAIQRRVLDGRHDGSPSDINRGASIYPAAHLRPSITAPSSFEGAPSALRADPQITTTYLGVGG
ncbi:MAG: hypothetical protein DME00_06490 [Candidatus Rokuibacteriota bacterium]|nr:MAG: hypothetical protein DME00_06490 [Candidatus Rokubacteria bacterium]PYO10548.1 MAG: hypothetical protein DMD75_13250 [Candidatus Rokubacteria bacterium]